MVTSKALYLQSWLVRYLRIPNKFVLLFFLCLGVVFTGYAQEKTKFKLKIKNTSVHEVIQAISEQSNFEFVYNNDDLQKLPKVDIDVTDAPIKQVLDICFKNTNMEYKIVDKVIIISPKQTNEQVNGEKTSKNFSISGKVIDENSLPIPGATILLDGTRLGKITDQNGNFHIRLPKSTGNLIISFIGFETQTVPFTAGTSVNVTLKVKISELDECVVRAYGITTKRESLGSISSIKAEEIKDIPAPSIATLLQGKVAGLDVTNITGAPGGGGNSLVIRGYNSLDVEQGRRFSNPLWVVDGVPLNSFTSPVTGTNMLADVNPDMIESIEILKDASSVALYGSRAANGVILVTTKAGKKNQKPTFSVNISQSYNILPRLPGVTTGQLERTFRLKALTNQQSAYFNTITGQYLFPENTWESYVNRRSAGNRYDYWFVPDQSSQTPGITGIALQDSLNPFYNNATNFFPMYYRKGKTTNANIQVYGGTQNVTYGIGLGYYNEKGILKGTGYNRMDINANTRVQVNPKLYGDIRFNFTFSQRDRSAGSRGQSAYEIETVPGDAFTLSTLYPGIGSAVWEDVIQGLAGIDEKNRNIRVRSNFKLGYKFTENIEFTSSVAIDYAYARRNSFTPSTLSLDGWSTSQGLIGTNLMLLNENLLTYKKTLKNDHNFNLILGNSYQKDEVENYQGHAMNSPSDDILYARPDFPDYIEIDNQIVPFKNFVSDRVEKSLVSFFGRLDYNYKMKYLISLSMRADGSSVFGENNKWGYFPSIAAGWAFSEENFMQSFNWLDYAKLKVSWGKTGNHFEEAYLALGVLQSGPSFDGYSSIEPAWASGYYNPELTWEETDQYDVGIELNMFDYRLNITADYYLRNTSNLLYPVGLGGLGTYNGYMYQWRNAASISNSGIEFLLKYEFIRKNDMYLKVGVNFAKNWNRFEDSYNGRDLNDYGNEVIGRPLNGIYGYIIEGFYQNEEEIPIYFNAAGLSSYITQGSSRGSGHFLPGDYKIKDVNGNRFIDGGDRVYLGSALPTLSGGITAEFKYKNFDLNMMFAYQIGRHMVNLSPYRSVITNSFPDFLMHPLLLNLADYTFWQQEGDETDLQKIRFDDNYRNMMITDRNVEKVNWLKLKTLVIGYTLSPSLSEKIGLSSLRVFFSCENLFTLTNYSGLDPETVDIRSGIDNGLNYPLARKFNLGLTVKF